MEAASRERATIARRLCTISGFYRYAVEEELLDHSPAAHARRPPLDYESHATALHRTGALLVAAGVGSAQEHALISLLALNGLRISEALGAGITAMGNERGHRTLTVLRKGGKVVRCSKPSNANSSRNGPNNRPWILRHPGRDHQPRRATEPHPPATVAKAAGNRTRRSSATSAKANGKKRPVSRSTASPGDVSRG